MTRRNDFPEGTITQIEIHSKHLFGNRLGDPCDRRVDVYLPANIECSGLPLLVDIVGYTGSGPSHTNWKNFGENVPQRLDRLIAEGKMPPVVCVFPDCFTRLGGNQYINSMAMGNWANFLIQEMVPTVEKKFHCGGDGQRAIFGKSSGGYGAITHALLYSDFWSAAACHSGDMAFELVYLCDMPATLRHLSKYSDSIETFIGEFESKAKPSAKDIQTLMILAMAATYDPDADSFLGIRLPVTPDTCEIIPEYWENWLAWDPLNLVKDHGGKLNSLRALFIDCGTMDQYNLIHGARRLHKKLKQLGVHHHYEEFADDHSGIDYRMDHSLPYLARAIS